MQSSGAGANPLPQDSGMMSRSWRSVSAPCGLRSELVRAIHISSESEVVPKVEGCRWRLLLMHALQLSQYLQNNRTKKNKISHFT